MIAWLKNVGQDFFLGRTLVLVPLKRLAAASDQSEHFTGLKGKMVKLDDALDGCERILSDEFSDYPEKSLYMIGDISEVKR